VITGYTDNKVTVTGIYAVLAIWYTPLTTYRKCQVLIQYMMAITSQCTGMTSRSKNISMFWYDVTSWKHIYMLVWRHVLKTSHVLEWRQVFWKYLNVLVWRHVLTTSQCAGMMSRSKDISMSSRPEIVSIFWHDVTSWKHLMSWHNVTSWKYLNILVWHPVLKTSQCPGITSSHENLSIFSYDVMPPPSVVFDNEKQQTYRIICW